LDYVKAGSFAFALAFGLEDRAVGCLWEMNMSFIFTTVTVTVDGNYTGEVCMCRYGGLKILHPSLPPFLSTYI
jgi:hypothetical protein